MPDNRAKKRNACVSVIIPTYNVEKYVSKTIGSLISQSLYDIEIIVSDDCSTDSTLSIVSSFSGDSRIRVITHDTHVSASQCRKDAVLASTGRYVMFVDGDDYAEKDFCKTAYDSITSYKTDIIQFGTYLENCADISEARMKENQNALEPCLELIKTDLQSACFRDYRISIGIWNKIFDGEKARKAFLNIEDGFFSKANDAYAMFFLLLECQSYKGIEKKLYHYCFGRGMTGNSHLSRQDFLKMCQSAQVCLAIKRFVENYGKQTAVSEKRYNTESMKNTLTVLEKRFFTEQAWNLAENVEAENRQTCLEDLRQVWGFDWCSFISALASCGWDYTGGLLEGFRRSDCLRFSKRKIRTVALYYHSVKKGGAQRVVSLLANLLSARGRADGEHYRVVLITDEAPSEDDYAILPGVIRVGIPAVDESIAENYGRRAQVLTGIISQYEIDAFLYSEWNRPILAWDMLVVKGHETHPAFIVHIHSFSGFLFRLTRDIIRPQRDAFVLADALVTLSETDRIFWSSSNERTVNIDNPCAYSASERKRAAYGKHIAWIGRLSHEKQPMEIARIMKYVAASDPDVVCHVAGNDVDGSLDLLRKEIAASGLEKNVIIEGFTTDVSALLQRVSVLVSTSSVEGFPLTLYEAAAFGIPSVMYEIPWITYCEKMEGWVSVPQLHAEAAAEQILRMLGSEDIWRAHSDQIFESFIRYEKADVTALWIDLFEMIENGTVPEKADDAHVNKLIDQIVFNHGILLDLYANAAAGVPDDGGVPEWLAHDRSYRLGRALSKPYRDTKRLIKKVMGKNAE